MRRLLLATAALACLLGLIPATDGQTLTTTESIDNKLKAGRDRDELIDDIRNGRRIIAIREELKSAITQFFNSPIFSSIQEIVKNRTDAQAKIKAFLDSKPNPTSAELKETFGDLPNVSFSIAIRQLSQLSATWSNELNLRMAPLPSIDDRSLAEISKLSDAWKTTLQAENKKIEACFTLPDQAGFGDFDNIESGKALVHCLSQRFKYFGKQTSC
jgi:hypothetical protein